MKKTWIRVAALLLFATFSTGFMGMCEDAADDGSDGEGGAGGAGGSGGSGGGDAADTSPTIYCSVAISSAGNSGWFSAGIANNTKRAQSFQVSSTTPLVSFKLKGSYDLGIGAGTLTLSIYQDSGGNPDAGSLVLSQGFVLNQTDFPENAAGQNNTFDLSGADVTLTQGVTYWLVISSNVSYAMVNGYIDSGGASYSGGSLKFYNGAAWLDQSTDDLAFEINPSPCY